MNPKTRVRKVVDEGFEVNFSESVPLRRYYRSLNEMHRMAHVYLEEGSLESALILYTRFSCLLLQYMPRHPGFNSECCAEKDKTNQKLKQAIGAAEKIKKKLVLKYEVEEQAFLKQKEEELAASAQKTKEEGKRAIEPGAVIPPPDGGTGEVPIVDTCSLEFPELNGPNQILPSAPPADDSKLPPLQPEVPSREIKPIYPGSESVSVTSDGAPIIDRSQKPFGGNYASIGVSYIPQNRYGLRSVVIPQILIKQFLNLAEPNTSKNLETCGILSGQLAQNKFQVTHLIIPKQSGTPDSCNTEKEELFFDYQDANDLITVGWIHTHPSQTAFLSSVDLHTHCSYQMMLPEAVAVVCSPKYQETGIFMLTPDVGMKEIGSCRQPGFHPHTQTPPLFEKCPHAVIADGYQTTVIDFR